MAAIVFIILQIFVYKAAFWATFFSELLNVKEIFVSAQNIISLFKVFNFIHFNNLLGLKAKRANVNRKVRKLGNITWGISSDIL